jgi:hypothetical protein
MRFDVLLHSVSESVRIARDNSNPTMDPDVLNVFQIMFPVMLSLHYSFMTSLPTIPEQPSQPHFAIGTGECLWPTIQSSGRQGPIRTK